MEFTRYYKIIHEVRSLNMRKVSHDGGFTRIALFLCTTFLSLVVAAGVAHAIAITPFKIPDASPVHQQGVDLLNRSEYDKAIVLAKDILAKNPKDPGAHMLLSLAYVGKGNDRDALAQAKKVEAIDPKYSGRIYSAAGRYYQSKKRNYKALAYYHKSAKAHNDPEVLNHMASIYMQQGRLAAAMDYYRKTLNTKPDNLNLSRIYLANRDFGKAITYAQKALKEKPKAVEAYVVLGSAHLMAGDLKKSKEAYQKIQALDPKFIMAGYSIGLIHLIEGDYENARRSFDGVVKVAPKVKEAHVNNAALYHLMGDLGKAEAAAVKAVKSDPYDPISRLALANIYLSQRKFSNASQEYKRTGNLMFYDSFPPAFDPSKYFSRAQSPDLAFSTLANIYYREGLFQQTIQAVDKAPAASSQENAFLLLARARAEMKLGNKAKAEDYYARIKNRYPDVIAPYVELGNSASQQKDDRQAIASYNKAAAIAPKSVYVHLGLGSFYTQTGSIDNAIKEFEKVIALSPQNVVGYNQLAWVLADGKKDYKKALGYALKGSSLNASNEDMQDTLGWIHYQLKDYKKSLQCYTGIQKKGIRNPTVYYHLGMVQQKLNRQDSAMRSFEQALNITDDFPEAPEAKERFRALSGLSYD